MIQRSWANKETRFRAILAIQEAVPGEICFLQCQTLSQTSWYMPLNELGAKPSEKLLLEEANLIISNIKQATGWDLKSADEEYVYLEELMTYLFVVVVQGSTEIPLTHQGVLRWKDIASIWKPAEFLQDSGQSDLDIVNAWNMDEVCKKSLNEATE